MCRRLPYVLPVPWSCSAGRGIVRQIIHEPISITSMLFFAFDRIYMECVLFYCIILFRSALSNHWNLWKHPVGIRDGQKIIKSKIRRYIAKGGNKRSRPFFLITVFSTSAFRNGIKGLFYPCKLVICATQMIDIILTYSQSAYVLSQKTYFNNNKFLGLLYSDWKVR